jgi:hypothetical protein
MSLVHLFDKPRGRSREHAHFYLNVLGRALGHAVVLSKRQLTSVDEFLEKLLLYLALTVVPCVQGIVPAHVLSHAASSCCAMLGDELVSRFRTRSSYVTSVKH